MITEELQHKIVCAIKLIQLAAPKDGSPIEVAYSGGKDSDVILQLTKEAGVNYRAIYKNTTIDPPGTVKHAKEMGAEVLMPKKSFFEIIEETGLPTRFSRICCRYLKEYKVLDKCIVGVRKAESRKRAQRYKEPTQCRVYSKTEKVDQIMPILDWTDDDVLAFVVDRGIKLHPLYYDKGGADKCKETFRVYDLSLNERKEEDRTTETIPSICKAHGSSPGNIQSCTPKGKSVQVSRERVPATGKRHLRHQSRQHVHRP